jgi:CheY-like chemotaxis protein/two-component sensor histidine kinase
MRRDLYRRQSAENYLAHARRVEVLGRLAGGIAHDFNNLLTVIIGSLERSRKRIEDARGAKEIDLAMTAAQRAAALTHSLLLYSRRQAEARETFDVNACVTDAAEIVRRTVGSAYEIRLELDPDAGAVIAQSAHLASALLNLAVNARDAMPDGGAITLRTQRCRISGDRGSHGLPDGEYVAISVSDDGPGMPEEVAQRAFDPFFTTKDVGKGTGLGLAQVDAFARQNGGVAELETAPGRGVSVAMILPSGGEMAAPPPVIQTQDVPPGLSVLLVEDEAGVRDHAAALLAELGCKVVACADAEAALSALETGEFDLLFSDIVLPGKLSGADLAERAHDLRPRMAVVLATGYPGEELAGRQTRWTVLRKPYGLPELAEAFRKTLAKSGVSG